MTQKEWEESCAKLLVGKTVKNVRYLTKKEMTDLGWFQRSLVIEFNDGTQIFPSQDDEGNNAGALFTTSDELPTIPVIPAEF